MLAGCDLLFFLSSTHSWPGPLILWPAPPPLGEPEHRRQKRGGGGGGARGLKPPLRKISREIIFLGVGLKTVVMQDRDTLIEQSL